jgi:hypothetical protein
VQSIRPRGGNAEVYFLENLNLPEIPLNLPIERNIEFLVNDLTTEGYNIYRTILNF